MDRHAIDNLGFVVEDPIRFGTLDNCAICGRETEGQICEECIKVLNRGDGHD